MQQTVHTVFWDLYVCFRPSFPIWTAVLFAFRQEPWLWYCAVGFAFKDNHIECQEGTQPIGSKLCFCDWGSAMQFPIACCGHFPTCYFRPTSPSAFPLYETLEMLPLWQHFRLGDKNVGEIISAINKQVSQIATKEPASIMERVDRDRDAMKWREWSQST